MEIKENKSTKELVLKTLQDNGPTYLSGQEIANRLFLTRAAVWKAINALKKEGHRIEAVSNRGYCLITEDEQLSETRIRDKSGDCIRVAIYDEVDSTNNLAKAFAAQGLKEDTVFIAGHQTGGRGRRGRSFFSPKGTGVYISFLLHPQMDMEQASRLTCMAAVAVTRAIGRVCGFETTIKWVNDVYLGKLKICGILTEAVTSIEDGSLDHVVVGIGINIFPPREGFPEEIRDKAGAIFMTGAGPEFVRNDLTAEVVREFMDLYNNYDEGTYIEEYRSKSNLIGHYVKVNPVNAAPAKPGYALVEDIDRECRLVVKYEDGSREALFSGEVSVVLY